MVRTDGHRTVRSSSLVLVNGNLARCFLSRQSFLPFQPLHPSCQHDWHHFLLLCMGITQAPQPKSAFSTQKEKEKMVNTAPESPFANCRAPLLSFQKAPSEPSRSLNPAPGFGFGASQTLKVSVYVCLVARGKSKGRPKVPLQSQHGQRRSTSKMSPKEKLLQARCS